MCEQRFAQSYRSTLGVPPLEESTAAHFENWPRSRIRRVLTNAFSCEIKELPSQNPTSLKFDLLVQCKVKPLGLA